MNSKPSGSNNKKKKAGAKPVKPAAEAPPLVTHSFTKDEIDQLRKALQSRREMLSGTVNRMEDEALKHAGQSASGDLSSMPFHMADLGTDNFEQEMTLGLIENEEEELREISEALDRIEEGRYGVCEECNKAIPKDRVRAIPYTRMCVECKRKEEESGE